jgi:hypothetical protein
MDETKTLTTGVLVETRRPTCTVEIETMSKGPPKVTVRIDADDPDEARDTAVRIYNETNVALAAFEEEEE